MNYKRVTCIALSLLITSSVTSYADIPKGTVVIDDKAYDLHYVNQKVNLKKIYKQYKNAVSDVYIKANNGKWYNNSTGKEMSKEFIPKVTYTDEKGKIFDYSQEDGVEIELAAENVSFINANQVEIQFNKKMMEESILNKNNYKIGKINLSENDIIELKEDGKTVIITLENSLKGKIIDTSIFISEKILDINNNSLNDDFTQNMLVINDAEVKLDKEINKDINIIVNNYDLVDMKINGDIYINADNVKINKIVSSGNIIVNEGENRKTQLSNSEFKNVHVLSNVDDSITLNSIKSDTLTLKSNKGTQITANGSTKINKTTIQSAATLELISGSLGKVTINIDKDKETESLVEFKGKFKDSIIMESGAMLNIVQGAEIDKLDVKPFFKDSIITVEGAVKNIEVNRECILNILKKANVTNEIVVNCKSMINCEKGSKVNKLNISPNNNIDKLNIAGEFKLIEITEEANMDFSENTVVHKLVAYKNAVLNGYKTVNIKEIQADKEVDITKEDNARNKEFNLPNIKPIQKNSGSTSTSSGGSSSTSSGGGATPTYPGGGTTPGTVTNSKPEANSVVISGEVKVGKQITGNYEFYDINGDKEGNSLLKWYRADDMNGTNKTEISNGKTYMLTNSDLGKYISFEVTPVATSGEITGTAVMSNFIGPVEEVVVADTEKPVITLKGSKTINLEVGAVYEDAGATAVDNKDGNITGEIVITVKDQAGNKIDEVDTTKAGKYTIYYNVNDNAGNKAEEVTRIVSVKEIEVPQDVSVNIEVNGYDVVITVKGEQLRERISVRIINKETGALMDAQEKHPVGNKAVFKTRIDKVGVYNVDIKPLLNGKIITGEFTIEGQNPDIVKPEISLNGKKKIELEVGTAYEDAGATAEDNKDGNITEKIVVTITNKQGNVVDKVDTSVVGEYTIHYNVFDQSRNPADEVTRTVIVKEAHDTEKPTIKLNGNKEVELVVGDVYEEAGATAEDNKDGEITNKIVTTITNNQGNVVEAVDTSMPGQYTVHYNVTDEAGNAAEEVTRSIVVKEAPDTEKPTIKLNGNKVVELVVGDVYEEAGATAEDNKDGEITNKIVTTITNNQGNVVEAVDTSMPGEYTIHYNVTDEAGNVADEVTRTVIVKEAPDTEKPTIKLNGNKEVELVVGDVYEEAGATAEDNKDGEITSKIVVTITNQQGNEVAAVDTSVVGQYTVHYNVTDEAGNVADEVTRSVVVKEAPDTEKPTIKLNGNKEVELVVGDVYEEAGATAEDNKDGEITSKIVTTITNNQGDVVEAVDTSMPGQYTVHYNVTDEAGNVAEEVTRSVVVRVIPQEVAVNVDVNGYDVKITVEGQQITDQVSIKIINKQTGLVEFMDTRSPKNHKVVFSKRIEKAGEFTVDIKPFKNGDIITRNFTIQGVDTVKPEICLNGEENIQLEVGQPYEEAGATALDNVDGNITDKIVMTITNNQGNVVEAVNTSMSGEYTVHYNVTDEAGNAADEVTRTVIVKETPQEGPVKIEVDGYNVKITVEGEDIKDLVSITIINDETEEVEDAQTEASVGNKVIFNRRIEKIGKFTARINAFKDGEPIERTFYINGEDQNKDTVKPVITLKGKSLVELEVGEVYVDAGASAVDNIDGDLTEKILMSITDREGKAVDRVNTTTPGEYTVHYNVVDQGGNKAEEVTRLVIVKEKEVPQEDPVTIEVDGYNVKIIVEAEGIKDSVSITIINNQTGEVEDAQTKYSNGNKVTFERRIEKAGQFTVNINALKDGNVIRKTFVIEEQEEIKDTVKPVITLNGDSHVELEVGNIYEDTGVTAVDNVDGDLSDKVLVTITNHDGVEVTEIDTTKPGQYIIHYNVSDQAGNAAVEVTRTVIVKKAPQEGPVLIEVDGYNVKITIEGQDLKPSVALMIINKETGVLEDIQEKTPVGNKVVFERRIEKVGEYTAMIKAFINGETIEREFSISQ